MQPYWEHASNGHSFVWLLLLLIVALVAGVVAALVFRRLADRRPGTLRLAPAGGPVEDVLGVVRLRYARGEIEREQFLQTVSDLGGAGAYPSVEQPTAEHPPDAPTA